MLLNAEEKRSKLFSVNINDFPNNVTKEELELFADDSTAAKVCNSQENAFTAAQDLLDEVDSYSGRNGFQVHTDREKTEIMLTSKKPFIGPPLPDFKLGDKCFRSLEHQMSWIADRQQTLVGFTLLKHT